MAEKKQVHNPGAFSCFEGQGRSERRGFHLPGLRRTARPWQRLRFLLLIALLSAVTGCESCNSDDAARRTLTSKEKEKKARLQAAMVADTGAGIDSETDTADLLTPPTTLITLSESAYGNGLSVDDNTVYLATPKGLWRFAPNARPAHTEMNLGHTQAFTDTSVMFWLDGAVHAAPKQGGPAKKIMDMPQSPRHILASGEQFAWIHLSKGGSYTFSGIKKGRPRVFYRTINPITTPWMIGDHIFFVEMFPGEEGETKTPAGWRMGRVSVRESEPAIYGALHPERTPSILGGDADAYYYDLPRRSIVRVKADLSGEDVVADKTVCSPFSVSDRILCARVEGVFEVFKESGATRVLTAKPYGLTVNIATSDRLVAWINEVGDEQLALRALLLNPPPQ